MRLQAEPGEIARPVGGKDECPLTSFRIRKGDLEKFGYSVGRISRVQSGI